MKKEETRIINGRTYHIKRTFTNDDEKSFFRHLRIFLDMYIEHERKKQNTKGE